MLHIQTSYEKVPFLCNHQLRERETVIRAKSQETKASLQWKKKGKQRKAMGSTAGTERSGCLIWRNNAGRKLEGVLDLFLSVPKW